MATYKNQDIKNVHFTINKKWWNEIEKTAESVGDTPTGFIRAALVAYVKDCKMLGVAKSR